MNKRQMTKLHEGDAVRRFDDERSFLVTANFGGRVTIVRTVDITNPSEWDVGKVEASQVRSISDLCSGDLISHRVTGHQYFVTSLLGDHAIGARTREITENDCQHWEVVAKVRKQ